MWPMARAVPVSRLVTRRATPLYTRSALLTHPALRARPALRIRHATTQAGEDKTGHIVAGPNEGILFVDNIYPLKLMWLLRWLYSGEQYLEKLAEKADHAGVNPSSVIASAVPKDSGIQIESVTPRLKEGGVFVKFKHDPGMAPADIESQVRAYLKKSRPRPWWNPFDHVRAHLVRGRPWVEDLYRPPSRRVRVDFVPEEAGDVASELSQEQLYSIFRPYGKLVDIVPQPSDSKVLPKYALVDFRKVRRAIMATNCLHGMSVKEELGDKSLARLKMSYERQTRSSWIRDWLFGHPRIVIPIVAALVATITITIFDPIRIWFVKTHIQRTFHFEDNRFFKWVTSRAERVLEFTRSARDHDSGTLLEDRKPDIEQVQTWLMESADNFIVVQGPNGSGKREFIMNHTLDKHKTRLIIDCRPIQEAHTDSATINATAAQVGYKPVFTFLNSISGLLDLAAQSTTGVKAGFTETLDSQLDKILNSTAAALKQLALAEKTKDAKDAKMDEDSYLEAHPERRPVVVIDNFLHKAQESSVVYDKLAMWAAQVSTANVAHVIFLTTNASYAKSLSKALPDRAFRHLSLSDFKPDVAKRFVLSHLARPADTPAPEPTKSCGDEPAEKTDAENERAVVRGPQINPEELDAAIRALGGRLTDLEYLARRIKYGEAPARAVSQIVTEAASEIMKMHLLPSSSEDTRRYSPAQAWQLVSSLAKTEQLRYNEVVTSAGFSSNGDAALAAMEQAELISIISSGGRPFAIVPARPVYGAAFQSLAEDQVLSSRLDLGVLNAGIKGENEAINKVEDELRVLSELSSRGKGVPRELQARVTWLLAKVRASQDKIVDMEERVKGLKGVLAREF